MKSVLEAPSFAGLNHGLLTQFVLYDYRQAIIKATETGLPAKGTRVQSGNWEFAFGQSPHDKYPVVKHALFFGLS